MFFLRIWAKSDKVQIRSSILLVARCTKSSWQDNLLYFLRNTSYSLQLTHLQIGCPAIPRSALSIYHTSGHAISKPTIIHFGSHTERIKKAIIFICLLMVIPVTKCKRFDILRHSQANKLACYSFIDACRGHKTSGPKTQLNNIQQ